MGRVGQDDGRFLDRVAGRSVQDLALAAADVALHLGRAFGLLVLVLDLLLGHAQAALRRMIWIGTSMPRDHAQRDRHHQHREAEDLADAAQRGDDVLAAEAHDLAPAAASAT